MRGYLLAVGATAVGILLGLLTASWWSASGAVLLLMLPVAASAWYGGFRPGLLATALCTLATVYFLLPPLGFAVPATGDRMQVVLFLVVSIAICVLAETKQRFRQSERERQEDEHRFRLLIEQVKDYAIFMTDPQRRPTTWNEGVLRVLGFEEEGFLGEDIVPKIFSPEDVKSGVAEQEFEVAAVTGSANDDRWMQRKDGTRFFANGITTALHDQAGRLIGFMKVMRDRTAQKQLEDDLRNIAAELSEADRRKTEFLATLSHELRNPLAPIRTGLEVMKLARDDPATMEEIRSTMERQAQQMVRLIDDLLDVSRIAQGKLELRPCRTTLSAVLRSATEATRPLIDDAGHQLRVDLPSTPVYLHADPSRLAQVFSNLLNNASKYTPDGGNIHVSAELNDVDVVVTVKDDGVGIAPHMQQAIFDMFAQIERPLEQGEKGLGIGLTLTRRLVEMHGGVIQVTSDGERKGSEFSVRLPLSGPPHGGQSQPTPEPVPTATPRLRILVVDDNKAAADILAMVVKMLGNQVRTAYDGRQAVEAAAEFRPDAVLMDLGMPQMNGYEAAHHIRDQPWGSDVVLVALTGWGQDEDRQRTLDAGFDHHLVKPAEPADLQRLFADLQPHSPSP